ncbi:ATP-binding protein [Prauserella endophytica]|nr:LuxR family transcriptional regulator [Prauserella endophytica]
MVGREHECDLLRVRLEAAHAGHGQVVLVAGEPGIGKTRLAGEAARMAARLGMPTAWGRAVDDEGSPPFWPFRLVVRALAADSGDPWPELTSTGSALDPASAEVRAQQRFRVFEAVTAHLTAAAENTGLLVVLDDLQWADASSLRLLVHLVRAVGTTRLALVATYRDTEIGHREAVKQALGELAREYTVSRLRLVGLTEEQVAAQLAATTGAPVSAEVVAAVSRRSQGNPFFVGELADALAQDTDGADPARALPDGVRDAVRVRLSTLGECARTVVGTAAVLGSAVDVAGLAHVTGRDREDVLGALDDAAAAGVLRPDRWEFTHDLVREAARSEMPRSIRLDVHRKMAEYLQQRPGAESRPAALAHHWLESLPLGDAEQAALWAARAAHAAMEQCAWDEAAGLFGRAAETTSDPEDRCELHIARATALLRAYRMSAARDTVLEAARLARELVDGPLLARAALVLEGTNDLTWVTEERALCEEALALLPEEDSDLRARLLAQLSVDVLMSAYQSPQDRRASGELSQAAMAMAERLGDRHALHSALNARQLARGGPDGVRERLALGDRLVARGLTDQDSTAQLWGRLWRIDAMMQLGDLDGAEAELGPLGAVVQRLRLPLGTWHESRCRGAIALARGRFDAARFHGEQALTLAKRGDHPGALLPSQGYLAILGVLTGFTDETDSHPLDGWEHIPTLHGMTAVVHWYAGREEEARREYAVATPLDVLPEFLLLPAVTGTIELAEAFGDRKMLDTAYRSLAPWADLFCCGGAGVIATAGSAHGPLGVAAAALGRTDEAVRHLRLAIESNERAGSPPFAAIARYDLARTLARRRRPGDRDEASALATQAAATARTLGMAPLLNRAQELTRALTGHTPGPLTRREREIAALVSQGLTNRQIAAATHISERTAENHVQHILTKLGFTTRAQIAAWAARHR